MLNIKTLVLEQGNQPYLLVVQGMRGSGKTNLLKIATKKIKHLFVVDIRNEYQHLFPFHRIGHFHTYVYQREVINQQTKNEQDQWRFNFNTQREYIQLFNSFQHFANCTIIFDEADALFSVKKFADPMTNVLLGSRNNNVNLIFVSKRPFLIPIVVRSQSDEYLVFKTEEMRDIKYLEDRVKSSFPKPPDKLKIGEAIYSCAGKSSQLVNIPQFRTGDK